MAYAVCEKFDLVIQTVHGLLSALSLFSLKTRQERVSRDSPLGYRMMSYHRLVYFLVKFSFMMYHVWSNELTDTN